MFCWPEKPPSATVTQKEITLWAGKASAAGAKSQFIAAALTILALLGTLFMLYLGINALKSTNKQLGVLNKQLKTLNDQQVTLTKNQKILNDQLKVLNDQQNLLYTQTKLLLVGMKPFLLINGWMKLHCKNPDKNEYHVEILNISSNPAKNVTLYFRVIMRGEKEFEDIAPIKLKDIDKNSTQTVVKDDIEEIFHSALRQKYVKALTEKNAISGIHVYCVYKDIIGTPYSDKELNNIAKLTLVYCD